MDFSRARYWAQEEKRSDEPVHPGSPSQQAVRQRSISTQSAQQLAWPMCSSLPGAAVVPDTLPPTSVAVEHDWCDTNRSAGLRVTQTTPRASQVYSH